MVSGRKDAFAGGRRSSELWHIFRNARQLEADGPVSDTQLARLAKPFPQRFVHSNPSGGGSYVTHSVVNEKLLAVLGPFSFELVQIVRGDVPEVPPNPQGKSDRARRGTPAIRDGVVGAVCRVRGVIDGREIAVEEVGDCEQPSNWPHDGARLKDAMSDALKRCAMRLGVGIHLWSQQEFSLYEQLNARPSSIPARESADVPAPSSVARDGAKP